jgi:hypothetical protein
MANRHLVTPIEVSFAVQHQQIAIIKRLFDKISQFRWGGIGVINRNLTPDLVIFILLFYELNLITVLCLVNKNLISNIIFIVINT